MGPGLLSLLRLQGFQASSWPKMQSGPQALPHSLGSSWSAKSFRDFSITERKKTKTKNTKHQKIQKRFGAGPGASLALAS